jgi:tRNA-uridine 2-sulfurtransferase
MNKRAVAMLSGGLDSTLAAKLMMEQGIDVHALNVTSPFCLCTSKNSCKNSAKIASEQLNIPLKVMYAGDEYLDVIKSPKFGYGRNMNPCIDCRIFMNKKAKHYMDQIDASFLVTGEVLGQRPMSQKKEAMKIIEKESGLVGLILRPLCAKLMKPTIPEDIGIVDRNKLLDLSGRSRKPQIALTEGYEIKEYHCGGGGCLLTDKFFGNRLREHIQTSTRLNQRDINKLKIGRHLRLPNGGKLIVGRNDGENMRLLSLWEEDDTIFRTKDYLGPIVIFSGNNLEQDLDLVIAITLRYSDAPKDVPGIVLKMQNPTDEGQSFEGSATLIDQNLLDDIRV